MKGFLEIRRIDLSVQQLLRDFFRQIVQSGDNRYFHPHPFNDETAEYIAGYSGQDLYYAILDGERILGYGMLRGWDEGYSTPSIGIIIHRDVRGINLGKTFMLFMHSAAKLRGAENVRLKVYSNNKVALKLYRKLGYVFHKGDTLQLEGVFKL